MGARALPLRLAHVPCPPIRANHSVVAVLTTSPLERLRLAKSGLSHSCGKLRPALPPDGKRPDAGTIDADVHSDTGGFLCYSIRREERRLLLRALLAKRESWLATRTRSHREVLARRQDIHGCPDFPRVLLKILRQAVGAVDLSILLTESLSHHAFHYVVAHRPTPAVHATARAPRLRGRRRPRRWARAVCRGCLPLLVLGGGREATAQGR